MTTVVAVDLGASGGRVMAAEVDAHRMELAEVHRFDNRPIRLRGTLHWDVLHLYQGVLDGVRRAVQEFGHVDSVGIDSWAVDYGLLDQSGALVGNPVHYRDDRTAGVAAQFAKRIPAEALYAINGLQELPFNTVFQLVAAANSPALHSAADLLLLPDLLTYWLTGERGAEVTNASTTGLLDVRTRTWSSQVLAAVGVRPELMPPLRQPGEVLGYLSDDVLAEVGATGPIPVVAVGSHDTASAVVGVPAQGERFGYISSGTWSLVGVELEGPVLSEASREANFTNEGGVDGTVRYLRNVMGLWLLQESISTWQAAGEQVDLPALLEQAATLPAGRWLVDPDDARFLPPGDMPMRIAAACDDGGYPVPQTKAEITRCVLDSLALAYRRTLRQASSLSGREVDVVHVVGGGSQNAVLCQLTADVCGLPVVAGPVEATAWGNVLVQARALGAVTGGLGELRGLLRQSQTLDRYEPDLALRS
ncbi:MAG TPA: rhamnulokinase family protein [Jiangellaceae bacterium]|nr:rhamnulokinase family protein [Jiangellaceae bacterium]